MIRSLALPPGHPVYNNTRHTRVMVQMRSLRISVKEGSISLNVGYWSDT